MNYILSRCHAKRVGNLYVSICPLPSHNEKTGSFTIFPPETIGRDGKPQGKTTFCCFGCGVAGVIITFYQHYNSLNNRREACEAFEKELGIDIKRTDLKNQMLLEGLNEVNNSKKRKKQIKLRSPKTAKVSNKNTTDETNNEDVEIL